MVLLLGPNMPLRAKMALLNVTLLFTETPRITLTSARFVLSQVLKQEYK